MSEGEIVEEDTASVPGEQVRGEEKEATPDVDQTDDIRGSAIEVLDRSWKKTSVSAYAEPFTTSVSAGQGTILRLPLLSSAPVQPTTSDPVKSTSQEIGPNSLGGQPLFKLLPPLPSTVAKSSDPYEWFKDKLEPPKKTLKDQDPANWFVDKIGKKEHKRKKEEKSPKKKERRRHSEHREDSKRKKAKYSDSESEKDIEVDVAGFKANVDKRTVVSSTEVKKCVNEFGNKILESLTEVKKVVKTTSDKLEDSPKKEPKQTPKTEIKQEKIEVKTKESPKKPATAGKSDVIEISEDELIEIKSEESELEDGEISDDSDVEVFDESHKSKDVKDQRIVSERSVSAQRRLGPYNRRDSDYYESPKRTVRVQSESRDYVYDREGRKQSRGGEYWSDVMANQSLKEERVTQLKNKNPGLDEDQLLKSVASITKAKQKVQAVSQVKTLEEWLKVELETDSLQHLQEIVHIPFSTDLSNLSKTKRRKVKLRVKQAIEQEAIRRGKVEQPPLQDEEPQERIPTITSVGQFKPADIRPETSYRDDYYSHPQSSYQSYEKPHGPVYNQAKPPPYHNTPQSRPYNKRGRGRGYRSYNVSVEAQGNQGWAGEWDARNYQQPETWRETVPNPEPQSQQIPDLRNEPCQVNVAVGSDRDNTCHVQVDVAADYKTPEKVVVNNFIKINYSPEIHIEQLEKELQLVSRTIADTKKQIAQRCLGFNNSNHFNERDTFQDRWKMEKNKKLVALVLVECEIKTLLNRTCFYGYPHRRVPKELLLESEHNTFKSPEEDVFLILMMPISMKPYTKLQQMKNEIEDLLRKKGQATTPTQVQKLNTELSALHSQRQSLMRAFTGYLNKKRIQKVQDIVEKYTLVYEHYKSTVPPTPDSHLPHIRTTQMDLRQHLILAKQYMVSSMT